MCKVTQYDNRYDILLTIDSPQMILALDYLFALKGFIDFGMSSEGGEDEVSKVEEIEDTEEESEDTSAASNSDSGMSFSYHINVVDFSVILLADPSLENTEALVFKAEQLVLSQRATTTLAVSKVGMFLCDMSHFEEERLRVLDDFSMTASVDTTGSDATHQLSSVQVSVEPLVLRLSLRDVVLVSNIIQKASALSEGESKITEVEDSDAPTYSRFSKTEKRKIGGNSKRRPSAVATKSSANGHHRRNSSVSKKLALPRVKVVRGEEMTADFEGLRLVVIGAAHELPVLDMSVKPFSISARSWSSDLRVDLATESFVNVFNPSKSAWEPLVETWDIGLNISRSTDVTNTFVNVYSRKPIEVTLTSQTIELLSKSIDFVSANSGNDDLLLRPRDSDAPYCIRNETGYPIEVWSDSDKDTNEPQVKRIEDGQDIPWRFHDWHELRENLSTDLQKLMLGVSLKDSSYDDIRAVSVTSEGEHLHILHRNSQRTGHRLLCDIKLENYHKKITFRSALNVTNSTHINIHVSTKSDPNQMWTLKPSESRAIPISLVHECNLVVMPDRQLGFDWSNTAIYWKDLLEAPGSLSCETLPGKPHSFFHFHIEADFNKSLPITWGYPYMTVNICAPVEIVNLLPYDFDFEIVSKNTTGKRVGWKNSLRKGETSPVHVVKRSDLLLLKVHPATAGYTESEFAIINVPNHGIYKGKFSREKVMTTHSTDGVQTLNLRIHYL
ncbi:membrane morphogenesis protein VPS13 [Sugiyamaella lignohabitans]|uniref:Membrane morphogenesis protein VPS13 n=1 Tax=Sugiyamaella lignohabitans TaxID=796027 RepID=A0A167EV14_9ASCO|nr:membrane morphogenesis protein VPS13 [Sugiyamaella lignohabitans]ANB14493.1 membrane morphogenesis protein VPS13 [Sugiyamaella lignohabitans]